MSDHNYGKCKIIFESQSTLIYKSEGILVYISLPLYCEASLDYCCSQFSILCIKREPL